MDVNIQKWLSEHIIEEVDHVDVVVHKLVDDLVVDEWGGVDYYQQLNMKDLEKRASQFAAAHTGQKKNSDVLHTLSLRLYEVYTEDRKGSEILRAAIACCSASSSEAGNEVDHMTTRCYHLRMLRDYYDGTGREEDLDAAIVATRQAFDISQQRLQDDPMDSVWRKMRWFALDELIFLLDRRYVAWHHIEAVNEAIGLVEIARPRMGIDGKDSGSYYRGQRIERSYSPAHESTGAV